ncbi:hypothetical protein LOC68_16060 [Blastopirellula sp. JC732]|uniref:Lipoprotein n=1 Tax=Blastopirellula sediminis TaxID=2894196 RepID=A0A9X1SHJ6_9BACT|nr:hypothetical protein [Blastopirellula sediminis]MCC9606797.1 hypothetical protein [Blastopirellula sediminis]MCC9629906.1 hypothetical protein [Blastopirellula sediminis]
MLRTALLLGAASLVAATGCTTTPMMFGKSLAKELVEENVKIVERRISEEIPGDTPQETAVAMLKKMGYECKIEHAEKFVYHKAVTDGSLVPVELYDRDFIQCSYTRKHYFAEEDTTTFAVLLNNGRVERVLVNWEANLADVAKVDVNLTTR